MPMMDFDKWNSLLVNKNEIRKIGAGVMIERGDGNVLLLKRSDDGSNGGKWCYPGGSIENDETAMDAATRECEEEVGGLPSGRFTGERSVFQIGRFRFVTFRYFCSDDSWSPTLNEEHSDWAWCGPNDISTYDTIEIAGQRPVMDAAMDMLDYQHSCVMINAPREVRRKIERWSASNILTSDMLEATSYESCPHVTILYGIRDKDCQEVIKICRVQSPVSCKIGNLDVFESRDCDVLMARIESEDARRLRSWLRLRPHENKYDSYRPHLTLAYMKKGCAKKYAGEWEMSGQSFAVNRAVMFGWQGQESEMLLAGRQSNFCPDFHEESRDGWRVTSS